MREAVWAAAYGTTFVRARHEWGDARADRLARFAAAAAVEAYEANPLSEREPVETA